MLPTIEWRDDAVVMVDQRKLPGEEIYVHCKTVAEVAKAIKTMVIRGAPAIGVSAAMGLALGVKTSKATGTQKLATEFYKMCELMAGTRPTAVNLFWAIDRMKRGFAAGVAAGESVEQLQARLIRESQQIHDETSRAAARSACMARRSCPTTPASSRTATRARSRPPLRTALGVIRGAAERGKRVAVSPTRRVRSSRARAHRVGAGA
jgi:methylthioribose-1-phosphate isomerase